MTRSALTTSALLLAFAGALAAQRPATAPDTGPGGKPPDTVLLEELTWAEARGTARDEEPLDVEPLDPDLPAAGRRDLGPDPW